MKKALALVLAAVMVLAVCGAFAADEPNNFLDPKNDRDNFTLTPEATITVSGLDAGDSAVAIQILEWVGSSVGTSEDNLGGWKLTTAAEALAGSGENALGATKAAVLEALLDGISAAEAAKIAKTLESASGTSMTVSGGTATADVNPGLYYVKITASSTDTIYNPVFVSADYYDGNDSIEASEGSMIGGSSVAKKSKVEFDKQAGQGNEPSYDYNDVAPGDIIPFKITATIPAYGEAYKNPVFTITDKFSTGLELCVDSTHPFTVTYGAASTSATVADVVTITADNESDNFTVKFEEDYLLKADRGITEVTITYFGKVTKDAVDKNVNPMDNTATLTYSNTPTTTQDVEDKTRHYDFSFDGEVLGQSGTYSSELVKIGVAADGTTAYSETVTYHSEPLSPLDGATFKLTAVTGNIGEDMDTEYVTTGGDGHIVFHGLDAGVYTLEEVSAPAGFVKDNTTYYVAIVPTYDTTNPDILLSYKVLFGTSSNVADLSEIALFTMTHIGVSEVVSESTDADGHAAIKNTQGSELPSTGGIGTTIFYVTGLLMVLGAGTVLVARRKADEE